VPLGTDVVLISTEDAAALVEMKREMKKRNRLDFINSIVYERLDFRQIGEVWKPPESLSPIGLGNSGYVNGRAIFSGYLSLNLTL